MASIICGHNTAHRHSSVVEVKTCYGLIPAYRPTPPPAPALPPRDCVTAAQLSYIEKLKGDMTYAHKLTKSEASKYIDELKARPVVTAPTPARATKVPVELLDMVPDGYYAVQPDSTTPFTFLKVLRPKSGKYKDSFKVSTQHGPNWDEAFIRYPSGRLWIPKPHVEESILLVLSDYRWAARNYAREIGTCCRCNTELTDERSRHYGIGPDCETKHRWEWVIQTVDEENDGMSYETLKARGVL